MPRTYRTLATTLVLAMFAWTWPAVHANAGGKRAVPDLRGDAQRWSERPSQSLIRLPLTVHVATDEGAPVASRARVAAWVRAANRTLRHHGIQVYVRAIRMMPAGWHQVTRWKQRRRLAQYAPNDGTIHVFAIEELDRPTPNRLTRIARFRRRVRGLHWRYRGLSRQLRSREYIVVTRGAPMTTFAHELGHLFGLRHSVRGNNVMCSCRAGPVRFTADQGSLMRGGAHRFIARQPSRGGMRAADRSVGRRRR